MASKDATETVSADAAGIARATEILREGGLVAVPTETVFGLAARADSDAAVARIYEAKGRPSFNPLIVHVRNLKQAARFADFSSIARSLAKTAWPGPLTLVLPRCDDAGIAEAVTAGLPTVALRVPAHPVMRALLDRCDFPLAAPSANRSGYISPTSVAHVLASLDGRIDLVLDPGEQPCEAGLESTILAVRDDGTVEELRPGPFDYARAGAGASAGRREIEAPGQSASHYSPGKPVRLEVKKAEADEFHIGFGEIVGDCSLSRDGDRAEAAASLYACLHEAAASEMPRIAIAPVPEIGIGRALNDRLRRAAAPED